MSVLELPAVRSAWLIVTLGVLLAGDAIRFTIGWTAFGVIAVSSGLIAVLLLAVDRRRWQLGALPYPLLVFLALATVSLAWSAYPAATALGLFTTWLITLAAVAMAVTVTLPQLLRALGAVIGFVLAASVIFELVVATIVRAPVLPLFTQPGVDYSQYETIPRMLFWSRNELFEVFGEGRIQGIVGNANNLGFLALLGVIVFALLLADRPLKRQWAIVGLVLSLVCIFLTRSATVTVALLGVILVAVAVLALRRAATPRARVLTGGAIIALAALGATAALLLRERFFELLGRSSDLTGRLGIWDAVIALAEQRPVVGWGWVSYWVPWAAPFDDLAFRNGVRQLQAHNAWIDVWFQLGVIGLLVFAALVVSTLVRSWSLAIDRPQHVPGRADAFRAATMLPILELAALLVQSAAESRLLVEFGWAFLVVFAVMTKRGQVRSEVLLR